MNEVIFFFPVDQVAKNLARWLTQRGFPATTRYGLRQLWREAKPARLIVINVSKRDEPFYLPKLLLAVLIARLRNRGAVLLFTIDAVDLCDRWWLCPFLYLLNWLMVRASRFVYVLSTRQHLRRRYFLRDAKCGEMENFPDLELWSPVAGPETSDELVVLYHGELAPWHAVHRFRRIMEVLGEQRPVKLLVVGTLYPTSFTLGGIRISSEERRYKVAMKKFLRSDPRIEWLGRKSPEEILQLMTRAHFYLAQLGEGTVIAETELRTCLLEAMAAGMPCLHTPTRALQQPHTRVKQSLFKDGENIVLISASQPAESAEKIGRLFRTPAQLNKIRHHARQTAEQHFGVESWVEQFMQQFLARG